MSESDSFIDEVNEEVRRDRLFAKLRKYGWIGVLAVVVIVGGAAYNEYRKVAAATAAQARGAALLAALQLPGPQSRIDALGKVTADGDMAGIVGLLTAAEQMAAEDPEGAVATLTPVASSTEIPAAYSDLAALKIVLIGGDSVTPDLRAQLLTRLATPGAPYRPLALEQQVLDLAAAGETEAAITAAQSLLEEPGLTQGLLRRVTQLMLALGVTPGDAAG